MIEGFGTAINIPDALGENMRKAKLLLPNDIANWAEEKVMYFFADEENITMHMDDFENLDGIVMFSQSILKELPAKQMLDFLLEIAVIELVNRNKIPIFENRKLELVREWIGEDKFAQLLEDAFPYYL